MVSGPRLEGGYRAQLSLYLPKPSLDLPLQVTVSGVCRGVTWTGTANIIRRPADVVSMGSSTPGSGAITGVAVGDETRLDLLIDGPLHGAVPLTETEVTCELTLKSSREVALRMPEISTYLDFELSRMIPVIIVPDLSDQLQDSPD